MWTNFFKRPFALVCLLCTIVLSPISAEAGGFVGDFQVSANYPFATQLNVDYSAYESANGSTSIDLKMTWLTDYLVFVGYSPYKSSWALGLCSSYALGFAETKEKEAAGDAIFKADDAFLTLVRFGPQFRDYIGFRPRSYYGIADIGVNYSMLMFNDDNEEMDVLPVFAQAINPSLAIGFQGPFFGIRFIHWGFSLRADYFRTLVPDHQDGVGVQIWERDSYLNFMMMGLYFHLAVGPE